MFPHLWPTQCHGIKNDKGNLVCGDHLVYSHPRWPGGECVCQRQSSSYAYNKGEGYEAFIRRALHALDVSAFEKKPAIDFAWHKTQRDLKSKHGARDFARGGGAVVNSKEENCENSSSSSKFSRKVRVNSVPDVSAFPTDAAERAKERREEREAAILEAGGTQEDV